MRPYLLLTPGPLTTSESVKTAMMMRINPLLLLFFRIASAKVDVLDEICKYIT